MHRALVAGALIGSLAMSAPATPQTIAPGAGAAATPSVPTAGSRPGLPPPRDARPAARSGTARIGGRVTVAETGAPVRRAQVQLTSPGSGPRSTTTDADGRYEITGLPAGNYMVTASKPGLVAGSFGQRRPNEQSTPFAVADGETKTRVDLSLRRGGVIVARVTDEFGDPIVGAQVQVQRYRYGPNGRQLVIAPTGGMSMTDDQGQTRAFGLAPGEYVVSAVVRTFNMVAAPGADDRSDGYPNTYFPGTTNPADAETVVVEAGQEVSAQFALTGARLVRVSGRVMDSEGRPAAGAQLSLVSPTGGGFAAVGGGQVSPDGSFSLARVPPGDYVLRVVPRAPIPDTLRRVAASGADVGAGGITTFSSGVVTGFVVGDVVGSPLAPGDGESAAVPIVVGGDDVTGLMVTTRRGGVISGRLVFDGGSTRPPAGQARVTIQPLESGQAMFGVPFDPRVNGQVAADGTFKLRATAGKVLFRAGGAAWILKSVTLRGQDITDQPIELSGTDDLDDLEVVMTDRPTEVTGTVVDERGRAPEGATVIALPAAGVDGAAAQRFTRVVRVSATGALDLRGLPPDTYRIAAFDALEAGEEWNPRVRGRVREVGERVTLVEGQKLSVTLRLARAR